MLLGGKLCFGPSVGAVEESEKLPVSSEGAARRGFQEGEGLLVCGEGTAELRQGCFRVGQTRFAVAFGLQGLGLELVFAFPFLVLDFLQSRLPTGLLQGADPGLAALIFGLGRFPARLEGRIRLFDLFREPRGQGVDGFIAPTVERTDLGAQLQVELFLRGSELPQQALEALQEFERLFHSQMATHSLF